jgi:hypothetical protein
MIADELRRQADAFLDLLELKSVVGRTLVFTAHNTKLQRRSREVRLIGSPGFCGGRRAQKLQNALARFVLRVHTLVKAAAR